MSPPRYCFLSTGLIFLAACAQLPSPSAPRPVERPEQVVGKSIEKHRRLALQSQQAGDLAAAATQWQILTLLAPQEEDYRRELATTRATISRGVREQVQAGTAALRIGDTDAAAQAMLRALALAPDNAEAARTLREIERQRIAKIQSERVARLRRELVTETSRSTRPMPVADSPQAYDIDQSLEMFTAGDTTGGLRELRRYVDANPKDAVGRQRIGAAVYERARQLDRQGAHEQALTLYDQAVALRGEAAPGWEARTQALRKTLADEHYQQGMRVYRDDVAAAVKHWEASLRFDPNHLKARSRLEEARRLQEKLKAIETEKPRQ